jgi:MFS family permease
VIISMLVTWMLTAAVVVVILSTPILMQRLHGIAPLTTLIGSVGATLGITVAAILVGVLLDRFGALAVTLVGVPLLILTTYGLYIGTAAAPGNLVALYALAGTAAGIITVVPYVMVKAFPGSVRFSGVSFSYNVAYAIFGGLTPVAIQLLLTVDKLGPAHYVAATSLIGLIAVAIFATRKMGETR